MTPPSDPTRASPMPTATAGFVRHMRGDLQGAIADYTTSLEFDPTHAITYFNRGLARHALGDADGAIADYSMAVQAPAPNPQAYSQPRPLAPRARRSGGRDRRFRKGLASRSGRLAAARASGRRSAAARAPRRSVATLTPAAAAPIQSVHGRAAAPPTQARRLICAMRCTGDRLRSCCLLGWRSWPCFAAGAALRFHRQLGRRPEPA